MALVWWRPFGCEWIVIRLCLTTHSLVKDLSSWTLVSVHGPLGSLGAG